jgi:hypothetical protein
MFIRFGASCCPTWDPTNWFSRRLPTLFGIKSRPAENEKLLRTESEEEVFRKRPKRKVRRRRNSADDTVDSHQLSTADTAGASADQVTNGHSAAASHAGQNSQNLVTSGGEEKTISESSSFTSDSQIKPGKGRSRREQAALAAKSRRGGRGGYTAANLRRFAAEKKDKSLEKRSVSLTAIKNHSGTSSSNSTNHQPVVTKGT